MAAYVAAGETSTTICTVLAALLAFLLGVPGGGVILALAVVWVVIAIASTTFTPKGDYYKARQALRAS
jgi:energy-converting hydrogenase Eha subunit B